MERKGDDALSNPSDALRKGKAPVLTVDQDQEGDAHADVTRLLDEIQALLDQKAELQIRLDDARKNLHGAEAEKSSVAAKAQHLEDELVRNEEDLAAAASASKDFQTEADRLKQAFRDLEVDLASLTIAKATMESQIAALKGQLLTPAEFEALREEVRELESKDIDLRAEVRSSVEQGEAAVEEQVKIGEARMVELQQVIKALEETNARREAELAVYRLQIDRNLGIQREHEATVAEMERRLKVSRLLAAVTSVGALAAVSLAAYLHTVRPR